jgi:hypothetical protein
MPFARATEGIVATLPNGLRTPDASLPNPSGHTEIAAAPTDEARVAIVRDTFTPRTSPNRTPEAACSAPEHAGMRPESTDAAGRFT